MPDVRKDPRYIVANPEVRSELSVPLIDKGRVIGIIDLEHTRVNYYTEEHQTTLTTLAAQVAVSIINARLYQRISDEEQRLERDLAMAREVQLRLLPSTPPQPRNAEIATAFLPARSIGGDIYDIIDYSAAPGRGKNAQPKRVAIVLGDVSGKAAPAALYAALVSGILRSLAARKLPPAELLAELNQQLQERKLDAQYVTMLMAVWDDEQRALRLANAGSVQPLYVTNTVTDAPRLTKRSAKTNPNLDPRQAGRTEPRIATIRAEGFPLGLFPNVTYDEHSITARPGDLVVFFSDGIVDAMNDKGEMFGTERLVEVLRDNPSSCTSARATIDAILAAVETFQFGTAHFDDETLVVLRVL